MMAQISEENFELYREIFECFCDNRGTTVRLKKLEHMLQCIGYNPTMKEMETYKTILKTKAPDKIEFGEFIELMKKVEKLSGAPEEQESQLRRAFDYFDRDGRYMTISAIKSGFLERCELKRFLCDKGVEDPRDDDVEYVLKCADTNHDGKIDVTEFCKLLQSFSKKTRRKATN